MLVYTITLKSDAGKELLTRYQQDDNWPEQGWNIISDEYIANNWVECEEEDAKPDPSGRRKKLLRLRKRNVRYHPSYSDDGLPPIPDPLNEHDDLRHHPQARGCVACRVARVDCTLRTNDKSTWPCQYCLEQCEAPEPFVCEPIIQPDRKLPCGNCSQEGRECSYNDRDSDHKQDCQQCQEANLTCKACPDMESRPRRIAYTPPCGVEYIPYRRYVTCTACRQVKKSCSLKRKSDRPPCRACNKAGIPCTFEKTRKNAAHNRAMKNRRRHTVKHINPVSTMKHSPSATKDYEPPDDNAPAAYHVPLPPSADNMDMTDAHGHKGVFREILTALPHPITFDTRPPASADRPPPLCRFCADASFGLFGLSWKKASVIAWHDGRGYTEVMAGHRENGAQPAAMCRACVVRRVDVIGCEEHEVESLFAALPSQAEKDVRYAAAVKRMLEKKPAPEDCWCSVCTQLAVWRCCAEVPPDEEEEEQDGEGESGLTGLRPREGCGLHFCEECKTDWEMLGRDFQELLEQKLATERGVMQCRADTALLLEEGLLMKNVSAAMALEAPGA
ncbi:hypothetical protein B0J12DRAFT_565408 [Macrophomina phaseolina]|uniref:Zn(2)-C6 fungal-type domain-containing protein n=1 Tax=Macrophomina phaseolina TaxID=35725 RepID=A0ABQ8GPV6_9PEZI|nr:hypothetical protein B0J12DRAFT_565408 [Macrophomina phaseolina]